MFGLFLLWATPAYDTSDDLMMQLIASGFFTGHPDGHLVFTNILIGWLLRFLYGTWAGCNWYFFYLMAVHYAALTAIAFLVVSRRGGWLFTSLYVGFFLTVELHMLLHLQFTTTAFLAGTAGVLLAVDGHRLGLPVNWPKVVAGAAFVAVACSIREHAALLLAAVASPFLLERLTLIEWRRWLGTGLAFVGIFLVLHEVNRWAYLRDPGWAEFSQYNSMRGEIHTTPLEKFIPQAGSAVGWSENDGWLFAKFCFSDPEVYASVPKMRAFLDNLKTLARSDAATFRNFLAQAPFLPHVFRDDTSDLVKLAPLTGIWCIAFAGAFRRRCLVTLLISFCLFTLLCLYLMTTARLPDRVAYNMPLFITAICLYWATGFESQPGETCRPRWWNAPPAQTGRARVLRWAALTLVAMGAALYLSCVADLGYGLWTANSDNRNLERASHNMPGILGSVWAPVPGKKTPILILMSDDNSVLERGLFFAPRGVKDHFCLVPFGWASHSPIFNEVLEQHQLHPYSLSLVDRPDVFFLLQRRWLEPLRIFYREHYGLDIRFEATLNTDEMSQFQDCQLHLYQAHAIGSEPSLKIMP